MLKMYVKVFPILFYWNKDAQRLDITEGNTQLWNSKLVSWCLYKRNDES